MTWRDVSAMTGEGLLQDIETVLQYNENFRINDGQMKFKLTVVSGESLFTKIDGMHGTH